MHFLLRLLAFLLVAASAVAQPRFGEREDRGQLANPQINEASGLVASRRQPGLLWTHNDSGDSARVFAIGENGRDLGVVLLAGTNAIDWEDIAIGPGPEPGRDYLYCGDIGDNNAARQTVQVYRIAEPAVDTAHPVLWRRVAEVEQFFLRYPGGPRDAETLMSDPLTGDLIVVTKREDTVHAFRAEAGRLRSGDTIVLEEIAALPGVTWAVSGEISPDGSEILVKTYPQIFYYRRNPGESLAQAFTHPPDSLPYTLEPQGEAVAWADDGSGYYTTSEEAGNVEAHLYFYPRLKPASDVHDHGSLLPRTTGPDLSRRR